MMHLGPPVVPDFINNNIAYHNNLCTTQIVTYGKAEIGTVPRKLSCYPLFNHIQLYSLSTLNEAFPLLQCMIIKFASEIWIAILS